MTALAAAKEDIAKNPAQPVPVHLRDSHTAFNRSLGNGAEYVYSHDCEGGISGQDYMQTPKTFYRPTLRGAEKQIAERLEEYKTLKRRIKNGRQKS